MPKQDVSAFLLLFPLTVKVTRRVKVRKMIINGLHRVVGISPGETRDLHSVTLHTLHGVPGCSSPVFKNICTTVV